MGYRSGRKILLKGQGMHRTSLPGYCRVCGCTDDAGCIVDGAPCSWVDKEHTLCTACKERR